MTRQLHPEIFKSHNETSVQTIEPATPTTTENQNTNLSHTFEDPQNHNPVDKVDIQILSMKLDTLNKHIKDLETQMGIQGGRTDEVTKASKLKFDGLQKAQKQMELQYSHSFQKIQAHFADLAGKVTAQKLRDNKIEELMSRQNQMIQAFEASMKDMRKVAQEQQYQIMNLKGALKEALRRLHK